MIWYVVVEDWIDLNRADPYREPCISISSRSRHQRSNSNTKRMCRTYQNPSYFCCTLSFDYRTGIINGVCQVGANHEAIRLYTELIASRSKSFKTNCDRLSVMYEYRYCQVLFLLLRLSITSWHNFDGKYLTAQDRHDNIAPAIRSMHLLREIKRDKTLNRWCSVKNADYKFNKDGIMQALVLYPTDEREYLVDAQKLFAEALSLN